MAQYLRETISPGGGTVTRNLSGVVNATISAVETAGSPITLQTFGATQRTDSIAANGTVLVYNVSVDWIQIIGSGTLTIDISGPDWRDPKTLTAIGGPITTDIGVANTYAKDSTLTSGAVRVGGTTTVVQAAGSAVQILDSGGTNKLTVSAAGKASVAQNALASTDQPDVSVNQTNPLKVKVLATLVVAQSLAPTAVAEATAETTELTGSTTLALGQSLSYAIACEGVVEVAAATEVVQYIALKGATSGNYYAVAYAGETAVATIPVPQAEKVNLVARNSSAVTGINVAGYYQVMSP